MLESLVVAELVPSEMSKILANNVLTGLSCQPPAYASREFLCAEAHWLNGAELSLALGIAKPKKVYTLLVAGQCLYFMCMCYLYRAIPSWDKWKNEVRSGPGFLLHRPTPGRIRFPVWANRALLPPLSQNWCACVHMYSPFSPSLQGCDVPMSPSCSPHQQTPEGKGGKRKRDFLSP